MGEVEFHLQEDRDYIMSVGCDSVWITVGNISVHVRKQDEGVTIDLYPLGKESSNYFTSTYMTFQEAENEKDD
jgi:hypothetical protein